MALKDVKKVTRSGLSYPVLQVFRIGVLGPSPFLL
jgi:hypothetical protein